MGRGLNNSVIINVGLQRDASECSCGEAGEGLWKIESMFLN